MTSTTLGRQRTGDAAGAAAAFVESSGIASKLATKDPDNFDFQQDLWISLMLLGDARGQTGDAAGAATAYAQGLDQERQMQSKAPNSAWVQDALPSKSRKAGLRENAGRRSQGRARRQ